MVKYINSCVTVICATNWYTHSIIMQTLRSRNYNLLNIVWHRLICQNCVANKWKSYL